MVDQRFNRAEVEKYLNDSTINRERSGDSGGQAEMPVAKRKRAGMSCLQI